MITQRQAFDPAAAITYASLIKLIYQIYDSEPGNPTPDIPPLPSGLRFVAYVQMQDFFIKAGAYEFYGLVAQSTIDPARFFLVIRGTRGLMGWFDDLASLVLAPWNGPGQVGYGFNRIYASLRIVERQAGGPSPATLPSETFAEQVGTTVQAARTSQTAEAWQDGPAAALQAPTRIEVAGHSLGAALATLYVAQNAVASPGAGVPTPVLCTFGSPRVGDPVFAGTFDTLPITSWRVVNVMDVVPNLPYYGFEHINSLQSYNSAFSTAWTLSCWHGIVTYIHLIDPEAPVSDACMPTTFREALT